MKLSVTRRGALKGMAAVGFLPSAVLASDRQLRDFKLVAKPVNVPLLSAQHPHTAAWAYNGTVPGPEIRVRQGDRITITVENGLPDDTTLHCHGIRLPNAMDGVPHLTQHPIAPGQSFVYAFDVPDAGTYWYHPHFRSADRKSVV